MHLKSANALDSQVLKEKIKESKEKVEEPNQELVNKQVIEKIKEVQKKLVEEPKQDPMQEQILIARIKRDYMPNYPNNKVWHITTDNSVFLERDLSIAKAHQLKLNEDKNRGEVLTIKLD